MIKKSKKRAAKQCKRRYRNRCRSLHRHGLAFSRNMRTVCSVLVGEFLVDVHRMCAACSGADTSPLQEYLLHGRGCVILRVLHTISIQVSDVSSLVYSCCGFKECYVTVTSALKLAGVCGSVSSPVHIRPSSNYQHPGVIQMYLW